MGQLLFPDGGCLACTCLLPSFHLHLGPQTMFPPNFNMLWLQIQEDTLPCPQG